jgi:hypothetical protein
MQWGLAFIILPLKKLKTISNNQNSDRERISMASHPKTQGKSQNKFSNAGVHPKNLCHQMLSFFRERKQGHCLIPPAGNEA